MLGRSAGRGRGGRGRRGHAGDRRGAARGGGGGRRRRGAGGDGRARDRRHRAAAARSRPRCAPATCSSRRRAGRSATRARASAPPTDGARGATMPGVTEDMLARVMAVDFDTMAARSRAVADAARRGTAARTSPARAAPTSTLELDGRAGIADDGDLTAPGAFGNLPCGEGFIAPLERRGTDRRGEPRAARDQRGAGDADRRTRAGSSRPRAASGPSTSSCCSAHGELGHEPRRARRRDNDRAQADRQRARGREDPRHGARRVRRERRDRRERVGADPPRRRRASTRAWRSTAAGARRRPATCSRSLHAT